MTCKLYEFLVVGKIFTNSEIGTGNNNEQKIEYLRKSWDGIALRKGVEFQKRKEVLECRKLNLIINGTSNGKAFCKRILREFPVNL